MVRNIMAHIQYLREEELDSPYLGSVGSENKPLLKLSDNAIIEMNRQSHAAEVERTLQVLRELATYAKRSDR